MKNGPYEDADSRRLRASALLGLGLTHLGVQLCAGFVGIRHDLGVGWAVVAVALVFANRSLGAALGIPLAAGAFFGCLNCWGWPWPLAVAVASPTSYVLYQRVYAAYAAERQGTGPSGGPMSASGLALLLGAILLLHAVAVFAYWRLFASGHGAAGA